MTEGDPLYTDADNIFETEAKLAVQNISNIDAPTLNQLSNNEKSNLRAQIINKAMNLAKTAVREYPYSKNLVLAELIIRKLSQAYQPSDEVEAIREEAFGKSTENNGQNKNIEAGMSYAIYIAKTKEAVEKEISS